MPWRDPGLLLGQTCGLPYVAGRCGGSVLVARPVYDVEGAAPGTYTSALICRMDDGRELGDFQGARAVVNDFGSQSGYNALGDAVADLDPVLPFFGAVETSGAHRTSATMVADGQADLAAIDAVAWALFAELDPQRHERLRVLGWTRPMPALPFITAPVYADRIPALRSALQAGCAALDAPEVPTSVLPAEDTDYDPIRVMKDRVERIAVA